MGDKLTLSEILQILKDNDIGIEFNRIGDDIVVCLTQSELDGSNFRHYKTERIYMFECEYRDDTVQWFWDFNKKGE